jgi:O-succinylbenzoate synthase
MLETGVGRAIALAVATLEAFGLPSDLGPSAQYFTDDLVPPFRLVDGALPVPRGPGIGVVPDAGRVQGFATERLVIWP